MTSLALACAGLALAGMLAAVAALGYQTQMLTTDAAVHWASLVRQEFPEALDLVRGKPLTSTARYNLQRLSFSGDIRAIRIYNIAGRIVAEAGSDDLLVAVPSARHGAPYPPGKNPTHAAARPSPASAFGRIVTFATPLVDAGVVIGNMEVVVDAGLHRDLFFATALKISAVLLGCLAAAAALGCLLIARQRRIAATELDLYAQHDQLTGLPNHANFQKQVDKEVSASDAVGSLIICEIAGLDMLSQNYGLQAADNVVVLTAGRLSEIKPPNCCIGTISPGRFGLFLPNAGDAMEVLALAKELIQKLGHATSWQNESVPLSVHAGVAFSPADSQDGNGLIRCAELALRQAQEQGSPGYSFYNRVIAQDARRRVAVQRAVTDALAQNTFRLDFQPFYSFQTNELSGFEALLRLQDSELGAISPAEFIPIAEQAGLINRIGAWCLQEACRVAAQWPPHLIVAVNLSPSQFYSGSIISDVRQALDQSRLPAYRLEVEITEGTLLKEAEIVLQQLGVLRDMGISVALDDFGTGYSSLSYLWKFPFSKIKIDRSFVSALGENQNTRGILRTIIKLGHGLGLAVTAEGIETAAQFAALKELHCDTAQGYLLGRPSRVADLAAIILRNFADGISRKATMPAATVAGEIAKTA